MCELEAPIIVGIVEETSVRNNSKSAKFEFLGPVFNQSLKESSIHQRSKESSIHQRSKESSIHQRLEESKIHQRLEESSIHKNCGVSIRKFFQQTNHHTDKIY